MVSAVAAFDRDSFVTHELDFRRAANGPVTLFWNPTVFAESTAWLRDAGYTLINVDTSDWGSDRDLHRDLAAALDFPDYYGANLHGLNDCLSDVATYAYASSEDATGLVLLLRHYDAFARRQTDLAQALLDIYASQARSAALIGHRMLCLVQSDDPDLRFGPVGASPVTWNPDEFLDVRRHPDRDQR